MKFKSLSFAVVVLLLCTAASVFGQLRIDFNDRSNDLPVHTQEGFDAFVLSAVGGTGAFQTGTTLCYGGVTISVSPIGGNRLDDRPPTLLVSTAAVTDDA